MISILTDFSKQRPQVWPGLWEGAYEVYSVGETSAEVREGTKSPLVWARERYDWSTPGTVRWEVVESNFSKPGGYVQVEVEATGQGSVLHVTGNRSPSTPPAAIITALIKLSGGAPVKGVPSGGSCEGGARATVPERMRTI